MSQYRLRRVYGRNFRRLVAPWEVRFPETGLVLIHGLNEDTNDSSDSGKSSLLLAIAHLFGGCPYPATELQSWLTEEPYLVGAELEHNGATVTVERSPKGLTVVAEGHGLVGVKHKGRAAEAELDRLFGMDADTRALVTYRGQEEDGLFLAMKDDEKKAFLGRLLGLAKYEALAEDAKERAKGLRAKLASAETAEATAKAAVAAAEERLAQVAAAGDPAELRARAEAAEREADVAEAMAADHEAAVAEIRERYVTLLEERAAKARAAQAAEVQAVSDPPELAAARAELEAARRGYDLLQKADAETRAAHERRRGEIKARGAAAVARMKQAGALEEGLQELRHELAHLKGENCPTCGREWKGPAPEQVAALEKRIARQEKQAQDAAAAKAETDAARAELALHGEHAAPPELAAMAAEVKRLALRCDELQAGTARRRRELTARYDKELETAKAQLADARDRKLAEPEERAKDARRKARAAREQAAAARSLIGAAEAAGARRAERAAELERHRKALSNAATLAEVARAQLAAEDDLEALAGRRGFLGLIVDDVLAEAAAATNEILSNVANVRHVSFDFELEKEAKTGSVATRITPVVTLDGGRRPLRSGLSGGMGSAVQLAVDLGIGEVAAKRCGAFPGWLVLDESFDGLGKVSKESCMEMLQAYAADRLVLVVDHSSEFQGLFQQTVELRAKDGRVRILEQDVV